MKCFCNSNYYKGGTHDEANIENNLKSDYSHLFDYRQDNPANSIGHPTIISALKDVGPSWSRLLSVQTGTKTHFTRLTMGWFGQVLSLVFLFSFIYLLTF